MKNLKTRAILSLIALGVGGAGYWFLLNDQARNSIKKAGAEVKKACEKLVKMAEEAQGITMDDKSAIKENQEQVQSQWEKLGY